MLALNASPFPKLATARLALRQLTACDVTALVSLRNNDLVNKYLARPKTTTPENALQFIDKINTSINKGESLYWAITLKGNEELIGTICLWNIDAANESMEIGYELLPSFHGKKIMQEAILAVIDFALNTLQLKIITAFTAVENIASIKLLERNNFIVDEAKTHFAELEEGMKGNVVYLLTNQ